MGGKTFTKGTYFFSPLTVAANTEVTLMLKAMGRRFPLPLVPYMVTGANTNIVDQWCPSEERSICHQRSTTTGAGSKLGGSILAGAAITLGRSEEWLCLASAAMTAGRVAFSTRSSRADDS
jgi:hypothetical protein